MNNDWLVLALDNSELGSLLAYAQFTTEQEAQDFGGAGRGEMADRFELFINEDIPESFGIEIISLEDFSKEYRMTLTNRLAQL